jgi:hypothetical protein
MASVTLKISALDGARGGFPVTLIESGQPDLPAVLPAAAFAGAQDLTNTVLETEGQNRPAVDWPALGLKLFDLLIPEGPLRDRYKTCGVGSTLYLDIEPDDLARVPWELARSTAPEQRLALNLALSRLHKSGAAPGTSSPWPFRILILIGCAKSEEPKLQVDKEADLIERVFV